MKNLQELVLQAANLLSDAQYLCVLTGAGISVESGIPDFRSPGGLWSRFDPYEYATLSSFYAHPEKYWTMAKELRTTLKAAKPNPAHIAVTELEKYIKTTVVTQNIDFLHQAAGSQNVIEMHGTYRTSTCIECRASYNWREVERLLDKELPPLCTKCSTGVLKSDTILFGEGIPVNVIQSAMLAAQECDVMLIIGSSLEIQPAALLPVIAKQHHSRIIINNLEPTFADSYADIVLYEKTGTILPLIVKELKKIRLEI
ncbi:MAG: NAD-dependent deacetylase [Candidatus Hermodarchaeota archaeon]